MFSSKSLVSSLLAANGVHIFKGPLGVDDPSNAMFVDPEIDVERFAASVLSMSGHVALFVGTNELHYKLELVGEVFDLWRVQDIAYGIAVRKDVFERMKHDIPFGPHPRASAA